jgi:hypothetical protein
MCVGEIVRAGAHKSALSEYHNDELVVEVNFKSRVKARKLSDWLDGGLAPAIP